VTAYGLLCIPFLTTARRLQMKDSTFLNGAFLWSLGFMKWIPKWWYFNSASTSQSHRTCRAVYSLLWHLTCLSLNRCPFKRQCPVSSLSNVSAGSCLALIVPRSLARGFPRKPFMFLCRYGFPIFLVVSVYWVPDSPLGSSLWDTSYWFRSIPNRLISSLIPFNSPVSWHLYLLCSASFIKGW
jgi:hypothetical protein